jgi:protein SCO1/2
MSRKGAVGLYQVPCLAEFFGKFAAARRRMCSNELANENYIAIGNHPVPIVQLRSHTRSVAKPYDDVIKGKIVVIQFMFSNDERLCPMVTPNLVKVQKELEKQSPRKVNIVSISVDPDHDTPAVLKAYAKKFHVQPGWQFLTGRRQDIDWLRGELGLYYPEDQQFEHMNMLTVGREATGQWFTIRALNNPEVIAYTVRKIIPDTTSGRANPISAKHARSFAGN